jgi:hypothetical protein
MVELGLVGTYAHATDVSFSAATLDGQSGTLFADLSMATFGAELRWTPGLTLARAFERTGPYLAARAGGALVVRTSQQIFTPGSLILAEPRGSYEIEPFASLGVGVEHRFGDQLFVDCDIAVSYSRNERSVTVDAGISWTWY